MTGFTTPEHAVLGAIVLCLGGAVFTLFIDHRRRVAGWVSFGVILTTAALVGGAVAGVLRHGPGPGVTFLSLPPLGFALRLYVDGLSAVFLALIAVVSVPAAFHAIDYMTSHRPRSAGRFYPHLLVFIAAMLGLVSTTDMMWFFFIFWQMMTLTGWAMIRYERSCPGHRQAAARFLWMMQFACAVTMLGAAMLAQDGLETVAGTELMRFDFDAVAHHMPALLAGHPGWVAVALTLFLTGFGIKLGMWPFGQFWLPDAHPAAPSPVSALLSGVMLKTGVYGLMRYFLWLVPSEVRADYPIGGWGLAFLFLGTLTLFTGTFRALQQEQSKRLLAFSSIGQAGYILFGLGVCLVLLGEGTPATGALAGIALTGALFHTLNHGVFKSLLFLDAGAVLHATGTQDMNKLGGLQRHMPVTGFTALVGSLAIAGVPLLSGYASKWPMFTAALQGTAASRWLPVCGAVAVLTSALTLALMMKFYGAIFLSRTSRLVEERRQALGRLEVSRKMRTAQVILATLCVAAGLLPFFGFAFVSRALAMSPHGLATAPDTIGPVTASAAGLVAATNTAVYAPLLLLALMLGLFALVRLLARAGGSSQRAAAPWLCGYAVETDANRLRAAHYYTELHRAVGRLHPAAGRLPAVEPRPQNPNEKPASAWSLEKNSTC